MEHLIYQPSVRTFRTEIRDAARSFEARDWASRDNERESCPPVYPRIPWLGHCHENSSYFHSVAPNRQPMLRVFMNCYGPDWDVDSAIDSQELRCAHPSLMVLGVTDVIHRLVSFIQAWLYFGFLEAIFESPLSVSHFVQVSEDGNEWLYTRNLPAILEAWRRRLSSLEEDVRDAKLREARDCALRANSVLADLVSKPEGNITNSLLHEFRKLLLSLEPALSALHEAVETFVDFHLRTEIRYFNSTVGPFPREYSERLIRNGWCPFLIASAEIAMSPSFLRYVDAAGYSQNKDHSICIAEACKRNQIDSNTYYQQHCQSKCRCSFIKPNIEQIFEIFDANMIPVVQFCSEEARFELGAIAPDDRQSDYIAFSHVWADGLGSCSEKGIYECQARRLHLLTEKKLTYGSWFWIDGLCVPKNTHYRGKAIELMNITYRNATGVIVLDSSLCQISISSSIQEIGWTLYASGWMGRLWTYLEGYLPPHVDLELSDGLYDLYELIQKLYKAYYNYPSNPFPFIFTRDLLASLQKIRPLDFKNHTREKSRKVVDICNVLTRRSTSRPDDQILVLGLLLDIDIKRLMRLTASEERWKEFYISLKEIPWTIVFDRRPKMSLPNFRWAPKTWISHGRDEWLHYDEELAVCSAEGLRVIITALVLQVACTSAGKAPVLIQVEEELYELTRLSTSSTKMGSSKFNVVFVRHFKHETPRMSLAHNSSVLMGVGVGFIGSKACDQLQYDFADRQDIQLLVRANKDRPPGLEVVTGEWEEREFLFT